MSRVGAAQFLNFHAWTIVSHRRKSGSLGSVLNVGHDGVLTCFGE